MSVYCGSVAHFDTRLSACNAVTAVELIEHLMPHELEAFPRTVFGSIKPDIAVVTTPNKDFNVVFANPDPDRMRHPDHKFEWTREEFLNW